jgi:glycosyltransferase involved in cell wall biosynthesis
MKSEKIKILHVCETGGIGGAETVLLNIVSNLDSDSFDSSVLLFRSGWLYDKIIARGIDISVMKTAKSFDLSLIWRLWRKIISDKIDIVHSHLPDSNVYCAIAGRLAGVPVITTYHGKLRTHRGLSTVGKLKYFFIRHCASKIISVSDYLKNELHSYAKMPLKKIATVYNGVGFDQLDSQFETEKLKRKIGILDGERVVGIVANMRSDKGYEYFIKAARLICEGIPQTKFIVVGEERSDIKTMMEKEIGQSCLRGKVLFLGFREDISALLNIMDIFILSSTSEGLSIATIEAMAIGIPVVATRSGGPEEIVEDGKTGFLVPIRDDIALAEKALQILRNPELARAFSKEAKNHVRGKFNIENMIKQYETIYRDCVD